MLLELNGNSYVTHNHPAVQTALQQGQEVKIIHGDIKSLVSLGRNIMINRNKLILKTKERKA
jgi:hypothetical protein